MERGSPSVRAEAGPVFAADLRARHDSWLCVCIITAYELGEKALKALRRRQKKKP